MVQSNVLPVDYLRIHTYYDDGVTEAISEEVIPSYVLPFDSLENSFGDSKTKLKIWLLNP